MKRDMDLIREILLETEKMPAMEMWTAVPLLGHDLNEVVAHVELAKEAGLVDAQVLLRGPDACVLRLTNSGYEFLEASKQKTLWEQAKHQLVDNGLPITVSTIKVALQASIQHQLAKLGIA